MRPTNLFLAAGAVVTLCLLTNRVAGQNTTESSVTQHIDSSPTEQIVVSLDGPWKYETPDGRTGTVDIPCRWDKLNELKQTHEVTFVRHFDLSDQFAHPGQRILVRCEAIGEFGELWINGKYAGAALAGPLPVEFDITGLVSAPCRNRLQRRFQLESTSPLRGPDVNLASIVPGLE